MNYNDAYESLHIVHDEEHRDKFWGFWKTQVTGDEDIDTLRDMWEDFTDFSEY